MLGFLELCFAASSVHLAFLLGQEWGRLQAGRALLSRLGRDFAGAAPVQAWVRAALAHPDFWGASPWLVRRLRRVGASRLVWGGCLLRRGVPPAPVPVSPPAPVPETPASPVQETPPPPVKEAASR